MNTGSVLVRSPVTAYGVEALAFVDQTTVQIKSRWCVVPLDIWRMGAVQPAALCGSMVASRTDWSEGNVTAKQLLADHGIMGISNDE